MKIHYACFSYVSTGKGKNEIVFNMNLIPPWTNNVRPQMNYFHDQILTNPWSNNGTMINVDNALSMGPIDPNASIIFSDLLRDYVYRAKDLQYGQTILQQQ